MADFDRKRILFLVIPSLQAGGMERVMSELASFFSLRQKLDVHLVLYGITREIFYEIPDRITIHTPAFKFINRWRLFYTIRTLLFLRRIIRKFNPDSILSFGEYWNSFVIISLWGLKYKVYISDRCKPDKSLGRIQDWLRLKLYPRAAGIIVQTETARQIYQSKFFNDNIRVIGNPIRSIVSQDLIVREKWILSVGRLIKTKHHDKLIKMFLGISKPDWKLVIVGYDHLKQNVSKELKRIIADNNASDKVILAGKQSDVDSYYRKSSIFAFTSSSEGFPNVIGEAMSAGLPVIAFNCIAGPSEMIDHNKNGFLIDLFDYEDFQEKLEILMDNRELRKRLGDYAQKSINRFSITKIGEEALSFLFTSTKL